jgi:hypothetical protein
MPKKTIWIRDEDLPKWKAATVDGQSKWVSDMLNAGSVYAPLSISHGLPHAGQGLMNNLEGEKK